MAVISIVVPVYKVEPYLERCVESLRNQTLTDIEIILVDDGSPDHCPTMCDEFANKDHRIKVIHKPNGGLSSARNAGLFSAKGKYIGFVDSDDSVAPEMYETMLRVIQDNNVDFVMSDYIRVPADGKAYLKTLDIEGGLYCKSDIEQKLYPSLIMGEDLDYGPLLSVWHCLYNLDFLKKNYICFDEDIRWSEDNIFSAIVGYSAQNFYYLKGIGLYNYYQNSGTITTSFRPNSWQVYCTMNDHLHDFFDSITDYDFSRELNLHMVYYACNCLQQMKVLNPVQAKSQLKKMLNDVHLTSALKGFRMPDVSLKLRIQLLLMKWRCSGLLSLMRR